MNEGRKWKILCSRLYMWGCVIYLVYRHSECEKRSKWKADHSYFGNALGKLKLI